MDHVYVERVDERSVGRKKYKNDSLEKHECKSETGKGEKNNVFNIFYVNVELRDVIKNYVKEKEKTKNGYTMFMKYG